MAGKRFIPERTVDSLLAAELVRYDPYALIWSPSQRDPNPIDHLAYGRSGSVAAFECKAVNAFDPAAEDGGAQWNAEIWVAQLERYLLLGYPVLYLLVSRPNNPSAPWLRSCAVDLCSGWCKCCARDERSWGALSGPVTAASAKIKFQPWFAHWAWVMTASAVKKWLDASSTKNVVWMDEAVLQGWSATGQGVTRLCHLLDGLTSKGYPHWLPTFMAPDTREVDFSGLVNRDFISDDVDQTGPVIFSSSYGLG